MGPCQVQGNEPTPQGWKESTSVDSFRRLTQTGECRNVLPLISALLPPWAIEALWTAAGLGVVSAPKAASLGNWTPVDRTKARTFCLTGGKDEAESSGTRSKVGNDKQASGWLRLTGKTLRSSFSTGQLGRV